MPSLEQLKALGKAIRHAREAKSLSAEQLEELSGVKKNYAWVIETAYIAPNRSPTLPSDETLTALATALDIPAAEFHAILGRSDGAAKFLVREQLARYGNESRLESSAVEELSIELEDYAYVRVGRRLRQMQEAK